MTPVQMAATFMVSGSGVAKPQINREDFSRCAPPYFMGDIVPGWGRPTETRVDIGKIKAAALAAMTALADLVEALEG